MKYSIILVSCVILVGSMGLMSAMGDNTRGTKGSAPTAAVSSHEVTWEVPIAAGIYYPSDGSVPENPVRYYRVRCWPGCHSGSSLGKYPGKALNDKPIYPTSTIDRHEKGFTPK